VVVAIFVCLEVRADTPLTILSRRYLPNTALASICGVRADPLFLTALVALVTPSAKAANDWASKGPDLGGH